MPAAPRSTESIRTAAAGPPRHAAGEPCRRVVERRRYSRHPHLAVSACRFAWSSFAPLFDARGFKPPVDFIAVTPRGDVRRPHALLERSSGIVIFVEVD